VTLASTLDTFSELRIGILAMVFDGDGREIVRGPIEFIKQPKKYQPG